MTPNDNAIVRLILILVLVYGMEPLSVSITCCPTEVIKTQLHMVSGVLKLSEIPEVKWSEVP